MRDDFDVEDVLRRYRTAPSARVKQAVLDHFSQMRGPGTHRRGALGFWTRPIPFYAAAAVLVILVGLSFAAGRSTSRAGDQARPSTSPTGENRLATSAEIQWVPAENDLL